MAAQGAFMNRPMRAAPPGWAQSLLKSLLDSRDKHTIAGDLLEEYRERLSEGAPLRRVNVWYLKQVLSFAGWKGLRRALLPGCSAWAALAAVIEFILLFGIPASTGISAGRAVFYFVAGALVLSGAGAWRLPAEHGTLLRLSVLWSLPFIVTALLMLRTTPFTPAPGVAVFLFSLPAAAIHASARNGNPALGIATALMTSCFMGVLTLAATELLHHPHPPVSSLPFVPAVGAVLGAIGGIFGSRFGRCAKTELIRLSLARTL